VLACARALGEAIMLAMVSGSVGFAPNPIDGLTFIFEPLRPLSVWADRARRTGSILLAEAELRNAATTLPSDIPSPPDRR